jgi:hypothetical protein
VSPLGGPIDSVRDFHPHELVHAVARRIGRPPVFFAEGLAASPSLEPFPTHFGGP